LEETVLKRAEAAVFCPPSLRKDGDWNAVGQIALALFHHLANLEGGREGRREGGREGGKEGGNEGWREGGREREPMRKSLARRAVSL